MVTMKSNNKRNIIIWVVSVCAALACFLIPETQGITFLIKEYLSITVLAILVFAFNLMSTTAVALALVYAYILLGVSDINTVFSVFATPILWSVLGGLILANVLMRIGLLRRISLKCIALMGGTYKGIVYGLAFSGLILAVLVGNATIPMVVFAYGICKSLGLKPSREAAGIMLSAGLSTNIVYLFVFNASYYMAASIGANAGIESEFLSYIEYFKYNIPMLIFFIVFIGLLPYILKPESEWSHTKNSFANEYKSLGKITNAERFSAIICILILVFMLTTKYHGINIMWGLAFLPLLLFIPGINVGIESDITDVRWSVFVFAAASITIGNVASGLGIGNIVATIILPWVSGMSAHMFLTFSTLFFTIANFLMTPLSMLTTFAAPIGKIAEAININPQAVYVSAIIGCDAILLPYESAMYYIIFAMGMINMRDWIKTLTVKLILLFLFYIVLLVPYWSWLGFLSV